VTAALLLHTLEHIDVRESHKLNLSALLWCRDAHLNGTQPHLHRTNTNVVVCHCSETDAYEQPAQCLLANSHNNKQKESLVEQHSNTIQSGKHALVLIYNV